MTFPNAYTRAKDFTADSGSNTDHQELNDELDTLGANLNLLLVSLQAIQKSDTTLGNARVHPLSFDAASLTLMASKSFVVRGQWLTATAYAIGDIVSQSAESYLAATAHTSGTFTTDLAAVKWIPVSAFSTTVSEFAATLLDDVTAAVMLTTLGVTAFIQTLLDDATAAAARTTLDSAALTAANVFTATQTWLKGSDVASAAALVLGAGNYFNVTGTTAITSIGAKGVGTCVGLHFNSSVLLTHHATDLVLTASGRNIQTYPGEELWFLEYATGDWRLVSDPHGEMVLSDVLVTGTPVAFVEYTSALFTSAFRNYEVSFENVVPELDTGVNFRLQLLVAGTPQAAGYFYAGDRVDTAGTYATISSLSDSSIRFTTDNQDGSLGVGLSGFLTVMNPLAAGTFTYVAGHAYGFTNSGSRSIFRTGGDRNTGETNDGIRLFFGTGNIQQGRFRLKGIR